jgi:hypothetical protein
VRENEKHQELGSSGAEAKAKGKGLPNEKLSKVETLLGDGNFFEAEESAQ